MTMVLQQLCEDVKLTQKLLSHEKIRAHRKKETQLKTPSYLPCGLDIRIMR
jgi:hypothetical protein